MKNYKIVRVFHKPAVVPNVGEVSFIAVEGKCKSIEEEGTACYAHFDDGRILKILEPICIEYMPNVEQTIEKQHVLPKPKKKQKQTEHIDLEEYIEGMNNFTVDL